MMAVNLYTSRVILKVLGVEDFGIYNVVGGVVAMFSFLNSAMITSTQRFVTYEIGRGDAKRIKEVFSTSVYLHFFICIIVVLVAETVGMWLLLEKMVIPAERFSAAVWTFHLSVAACVIAIMSCPYNAVIIAHEKMSAFAYISLLEALLKLGIVYLLLAFDYDKLILYAILMAVVQLLIRCVYVVFCKKHFKETQFMFLKRFGLFKEMLSFAGWNLFGNFAAILFSQGLNILLNMFFSPVVNAARAISVQVQNALFQFSYNFQTALNPQITKSYANGDLRRMHELVCQSAKFTFLLLVVLCLPVLLETPIILKVWLNVVPDYTVVFLRIIVIIMVIDATSNSLMIAAAATGRIRKYQAVIGGVLLLIVPISYVVLRLGGAPWSVFLVHLSICIIAYVIRLYLVRSLISIDIKEYFREVLLRCFAVAIVSAAVPVTLKFVLSDSLIDAVIVVLVSIVSAILGAFWFGLKNNERNMILQKISNLKRRACL